MLCQQQQPSELVGDDDDLSSNVLPRNVSQIMEAADGSNDDDVDMDDNEFDELSGLEPVDSSECGDEGHDSDKEEEEETAEAELSKFTIHLECR